jgi:hypothetical protein
LEEVEMKMKYWVASGIGALALIASQAASAHVDVGINVGIPAPLYVAPRPPLVVYQQPAPVFVVGWHDNRYWDGRRWWERNEWNDHHHHRHDEHHDHHDHY